MSEEWEKLKANLRPQRIYLVCALWWCCGAVVLEVVVPGWCVCVCVWCAGDTHSPLSEKKPVRKTKKKGEGWEEYVVAENYFRPNKKGR
jgi:hypothetical protein